jgi:hypothetical protein
VSFLGCRLPASLTVTQATDAAGDRELCRRRLIKLGKSRATETDLEMISEDAEDAEDDEVRSSISPSRRCPALIVQDMPVQPVRPRRAATQSLATPVKPALTSVGPGSKSGGKTATKGQPGVARSTQQTARKSRGAAETAVQTARTSADAGEPSETEKGEKRDRDERGRKISQNRVPVPAGIKTTGAVHDIAELCPFCLSCLGDMRYFPDVACWIHPIVNETDDISCADCDGRKKKTGKCVPVSAFFLLYSLLLLTSAQCPPVLLQSMEYKAYLLIAGGVACGKMDSALLEAAFKTFEARKDLYFAEQRRRDQAYEDRPIPRLAEVLTEQIVVLGSRPSPLQAQVSRAADNTASATASIENVVDRLVAIETTVTQMHRDLHNMRLLQERMALKSGFKRAQVPAPAAASGGRKRTHDDMEGAEEVYEAVEQHSEEGAGGFQHPGGDTGLGAVGDEEMDDTV